MRLRPIVLEVRRQLADGRQQLREQHDRGLEGARVCTRYTSLVDTAILRLYDAYLGELPESDARQVRERVALVAHGGYGRRQQAPFSDVDLMILYEGKRDALIGQLAARLTQDICDVYQHLGHSCARRPRRCSKPGQMLRSVPRCWNHGSWSGMAPFTSGTAR